MSDLLFAKSLQWTCWDPSNLLSAMLHNLLSEWGHARSIRTQLTRAVELSEIELLLSVRRIDLAAWGLWNSEQCPGVCASVAMVAKLENPPLRHMLRGSRVGRTCRTADRGGWPGRHLPVAPAAIAAAKNSGNLPSEPSRLAPTDQRLSGSLAMGTCGASGPGGGRRSASVRC